jgi:hypothetical protein
MYIDPPPREQLPFAASILGDMLKRATVSEAAERDPQRDEKHTLGPYHRYTIHYDRPVWNLDRDTGEIAVVRHDIGPMYGKRIEDYTDLYTFERGKFALRNYKLRFKLHLTSQILENLHTK